MVGWWQLMRRRRKRRRNVLPGNGNLINAILLAWILIQVSETGPLENASPRYSVCETVSRSPKKREFFFLPHPKCITKVKVLRRGNVKFRFTHARPRITESTTQVTSNIYFFFHFLFFYFTCDLITTPFSNPLSPRKSVRQRPYIQCLELFDFFSASGRFA